MKKDNQNLSNDVIELSKEYELRQANIPLLKRISLLLNKISRKFTIKFVDDLVPVKPVYCVKPNNILSDASITQICYYIILIVKLAKIDGKINNLEEKLCLSDFINGQYSYSEIKKIYDAAIDDRCEAIFYINKLRLLTNNNKNFYEQIITRMLQLAAIDAPINKDEMYFIKQVAQYTKISAASFNKIFDRALTCKMPSDPYKCLGVAKTVSKNELNAVYRRIAKEYHPDNYIKYTNIAEEYKRIMQDKFDIYTKAYIAIKNKL